jgi:hypothetical protein
MSTMKNAIIWKLTSCGPCKNRRFGGTYRLHHKGDKNRGARISILPKCRFLQESHCVTSHKTVFLIYTEFPIL